MFYLLFFSSMDAAHTTARRRDKTARSSHDTQLTRLRDGGVFRESRGGVRGMRGFSLGFFESRGFFCGRAEVFFRGMRFFLRAAGFFEGRGGVRGPWVFFLCGELRVIVNCV